MQSSAATFEFSEPTLRQDLELTAVGAGLLQFWIPLLAIGTAVFIAQHSLRYATFDFVEGVDETDLVMVVGSSSQLRQLTFIALGAVGGWLLLIRSPAPTVANRWLVFLLSAVCGWLVLSGLWSEDTALSWKRSFVPLLCVVAAVGIGKHWTARHLCIFTATLTTFFVLLGLAAEIANGTFFSGEEYRFAGTLHPNEQAVNCAVLCLASLALFFAPSFDATVRRRWLWLIPFGLGMVCLFLTRSRTTTVAMLAALFVFYFVGTSGWMRLFAVWCSITMAAMLAILLLESGTGDRSLFVNLVSMGRHQNSDDITSLTGRLPIWAAVLQDIAAQPLCGYGYGTFWTPQRVLTYSYIHDWEFSHAHSAYFETLLNIGAIGLVLGLLLVLSALWSAFRCYTVTGDSGYRFIIAVMALALIHGFADSNFVMVSFAPILAALCISIVMWHGSRGVTTLGAARV